MTIAKDFASKAGIAFVALAMIFTMSVPASNAQTQTPEDLQKMINELMAQIETLKGQTGQGANSVASGICPFTWTRDLKTGATGADVMKLQQFLNADLDTRVSASGAGSVGMETQYFGPATAAAVSKFQVKYRAEILSPAGLVNPTGFFGPSTRAQANAKCVTTPTVPDVDEDEDTTDEDEDEDTEELSGEGELDTFEMDDASDTDVQENSEDTEIGVITMEATDGDIEVDRMTFTIATDGDNTENDPWEVFEEITLWVDGEKVAEFDSSDEDNYLDEDDGEFRFSGLELVLREDEEVEVTVAATIAGSVDDAGVTDEGDWTLTATEVRYFDADGVSSDDDTTDELPTAVATFDIVEEGDGEELSFSTASSNPDATDIVVDTDSKTTGVTIMEYNIEAEEGDIEINTLFVKVTTGTTSSLVIDDIALEIDGQTFDAENSASTTNTVTTFEFDIDGDITIDEGDEVTVAVVVDLKSQESATNVDRYTNGTTIEADVTGTEVDLTDAEGSDDLGTGALTGSANGESHTLVAEGIVIPVDSVETTTDTQGDNDTIGKFTIEFEVTAVEGDFYIAETATEGTSATTGVEFSIDGGTATSTGVLSSSADEETSGVFTVREGETETFTLTVTVDPVATGLYRVQLGNVNYTSDDDGVTATEAYTPTPAQDFRTGYETVQGS